MLVEVFKSKIHRVKVTQAELHYVGSITIDEALLEAAGMFPNQKVQIVNINNGERLETYLIKGRRNSGEVCLNGPAARKVQVGDVIIVIAYGFLPEAEARQYEPIVIFPDENNRLAA
ncbi:MAG: aspartate 1-decarboxylase [Microscillaceae bacterium]|nr:aspartate 1-decarboxylase [Microscillaceae bacterium]